MRYREFAIQCGLECGIRLKTLGVDPRTELFACSRDFNFSPATMRTPTTSDGPKKRIIIVVVVVKGHSGHPWNELADRLSNVARWLCQVSTEEGVLRSTPSGLMEVRQAAWAKRWQRDTADSEPLLLSWIHCVLQRLLKMYPCWSQ